jgi:hypothetical protein
MQSLTKPQVVSLSRPATATHIKETAVRVRKALVSGNLLEALTSLQHIVTVAHQLKKGIVDEASVVAASAKA